MLPTTISAPALLNAEICEVKSFHHLVAAGIDELVAGLGERRRQPALRIAPGVAVGVIGKKSAHDFVGRRPVPDRQIRGDHVLQAPEEMIGPGEAFLGIAVAAEEIRLPRAVRGDAGDLVHLGLVGDRVGGIGRGRRDDEIDLVARDQLGGDFRGARAARLTVFADDLDLIGVAAALQPRFEDLVHLVDDEPIALAETGERPGLRADVPDLDRLRLRVGGDHAQDGGRRERADAARDHRAAIDAGAGGGLVCDVRIVTHGDPPFQRLCMDLRCCVSLARNAAC
jgi:hypothetical protein